MPNTSPSLALLLLLFVDSGAKEILFLTVFSNHTIMRCELDGSNPVALVSGQPHVDWPDGVQVDVKRGKMYWTNMGSTAATIPRAGSVYSSNLDGTDIQAIVPPGTIGAGKQVHLDAVRQYLYVADKQNETAGIWGIDISSGPPFAIKPLLQKHQPSASGVTLDSTGEQLLITSDGQGHPSGVGVMAREIPVGMSAANRSDVVWHYTSENPIDVEADSTGQVYWSDSGGISTFGIRVGSVDGTAPARTIRTKRELSTSFPVGIVSQRTNKHFFG